MVMGFSKPQTLSIKHCWVILLVPFVVEIQIIPHIMQFYYFFSAIKLVFFIWRWIKLYKTIFVDQNIIEIWVFFLLRPVSNYPWQPPFFFIFSKIQMFVYYTWHFNYLILSFTSVFMYVTQYFYIKECVLCIVNIFTLMVKCFLSHKPSIKP